MYFILIGSAVAVLTSLAAILDAENQQHGDRKQQITCTAMRMTAPSFLGTRS